jgi:hypothetical protein
MVAPVLRGGPIKLYRYVIVYDTGGAPNYDAPCLTLALCKPGIRRAAVKGDVVLAFTGANLGREPHAVRWAGVVAERMEFSEYWEDARFDGKKPHASPTPDNIYRPDVHGALIQEPNPVHDHGNIARDIGGRNVLTFDQWWHFPHPSPVLSDEFEKFRIHNPRQGHRVSEIDGPKWAALSRWLDANVVGNAMENSRNRGCGPSAARRVTRSRC